MLCVCVCVVRAESTKVRGCTGKIGKGGGWAVKGQVSALVYFYFICTFPQICACERVGEGVWCILLSMALKECYGRCVGACLVYANTSQECSLKLKC